MKVGKKVTEIAIINANIYDTASGDFQKKTISIKDEKIQSIFTGSASLENHHIIDGKNTYITPGFIDTCSQVGLKEKGISWEGNDSYEPQAEKAYQLQITDGIYPFDKAFHDATSSGVTTAHIVSSAENVVGAQTAVIHTHGKTVDEMVLKKNLGVSFSMGDIPKKAFFAKTNTPLTRMGIAQKLKATLSDLQKRGNLKNTPIFIRCHRMDDIATAHRIAKAYQIQFILVHATEYSKIKSTLSELPTAIIVGPCFQAIVRNELKHLSPELYHHVSDKNINLTFATDHPTSSISHLQLEGSLALKAGASERSILNGLTKNAAALLQIDHLTGTIKEGLYADLVIWNGHPLNLTAKPIQTFIKGKEVYKEANNRAQNI